MSKTRKKHLQLIALQYIKYNIQQKSGLLYLLLVLVVGLVAVSILVTLADQIQSQANGEADGGVAAVVLQIASPALGWFLGSDNTQGDYLLFQKPALVSVLLLIILMGSPLLVILAGFNQLSSEVRSRGVRYLLLRTRRSSLFFGRFIGSYLNVLMVFLLVFLLISLYLMAKIDLYTKTEILLWMGQGFLYLAIFALPYMALCAWISASVDSPFVTLMIGQLVICLFPLVVFLLKMVHPWFQYAIYLMPWGYKYWLFHPNMTQSLYAIFAMIGFATAFLWLGNRHFQKRDL